MDVIRECLLELQAEIKQGVGPGRLGGSLWDTQGGVVEEASAGLLL